MITLIGIMMPLRQTQEIAVMVEREKDYVSGVVDLNDQFRESKSYPKSQYRGRLHFTQAFGKFEPDFWMLKEPVALGKISFKAVQGVIQQNQ